MVLHAPQNGAPRLDDLFLVLDNRLLVQGVSRGAEAVLLVDEPSGVDLPLDEFLISSNGDADGAGVARLVALAVGGTPSTASVELRAADDPEVRFQARITSCGLPPAALLILAPLADHSTPAESRRRAAVFNGGRV
jgi:hypothetical protein